MLFRRKNPNPGQPKPADQIPAKSRNAFHSIPLEGVQDPWLLRLYRGEHDQRLVVLSCRHLREEAGNKPFIVERVGRSKPTHSFLIESDTYSLNDYRCHFKAQVDVTSGLLDAAQQRLARDRAAKLPTVQALAHVKEIIDSADRCAQEVTDVLAHRILSGSLIEIQPGSDEIRARQRVIEATNNSYILDLKKRLETAIFQKAGAIEIQQLRADLVAQETAYLNRLKAARQELYEAIQRAGKSSREAGRFISKKGFFDYGKALFGTNNQEAFFWAATIAAWIRLWQYPEY